MLSIWLLATVVALLAASCVRSESADYVVLMLDKDAGNFKVHPNSSYLPWVRECGDTEEFVVRHIVHAHQNSIPLFFDFSAGFGRVFVPIAKFSAIALGLVSAVDVDSLFIVSNLQEHGVWNASLINSIPAFSPAHGIQASIDEYNKIFSAMIGAAGNACPQVIHLRYLDSSLHLGDIWNFLHHSAFLLSCRSSVYVDSHDIDLLYHLGAYMSAFGYKVDYHPTCFHCSSQSKEEPRRYTTRLLLDARPAIQLSDDIPTKFMSFDQFNAQYVKIRCPIDQQSHDPVLSPFKVLASFAVMLPATSHAYCLQRLFPKQLIVEDLVVHEMFNDTQREEEVRYMMQVQCLTWSRRIINQFNSTLYQYYFPAVEGSGTERSEDICFGSTQDGKRTEMPNRESVTIALRDELFGLITRCGSIISEQYQYFAGFRDRKLSAHRQISKDPRKPFEHYQKNDVEVDFRFYSVSPADIAPPLHRPNGPSDFSAEVRSESAENADFDPAIPGQHNDRSIERRYWLQHTPLRLDQTLLSNQQDIRRGNQLCGDSLWCRWLPIFQKRLATWQLQPGPSNRFDSSSEPPRHRLPSKSDTNHQDACSKARLLVFEPVSYGLDFGAILEQVVLAMRYAVCLNRVLVLADEDTTQAGTLLKWRMPGCAGSLIDCYFEPLSSASTMDQQNYASLQQCRPSRAELKAAVKSPDGRGFDSYPLRDQRVLVLHGEPLYGDCALQEEQAVHKVLTGTSPGRFFKDLSAWNDHDPDLNAHQNDSDLLPGIFSPSRKNGFQTAVQYELESIYQAPFLHHLLRPRAWVINFITHFLAYSMVSPLHPASNPSLLARGTEPRSGYLLKSQFPQHYIAIDIRFGSIYFEYMQYSLEDFMALVHDKFTLIRDVFVSGDLDTVIYMLVRMYPTYHFHHLCHERLSSTLNYNYSIYANDVLTPLNHTRQHAGQYSTLPLPLDPVASFAQRSFSLLTLQHLAELSVASEAYGAVGTRALPWHRLWRQTHRSMSFTPTSSSLSVSVNERNAYGGEVVGAAIGGGGFYTLGDEEYEELPFARRVASQEASHDREKNADVDRQIEESILLQEDMHVHRRHRRQRRRVRPGEDYIYTAYSTVAAAGTDIYQHIPTLRYYAQRSRHITECGVRAVISSWAFLQGFVDQRHRHTQLAIANRSTTTASSSSSSSPEFRLVSVDLERWPKVHDLETQCAAANISFSFHAMSDLESPLEVTDLLFIDTFHVYGQLVREFRRYEPWVRRYILLHDTTVDAQDGEILRQGHNLTAAQVFTGFPVEELNRGLWPAVEEFLARHPTSWRLKKRYTNCNGLTVLERINDFVAPT